MELIIKAQVLGANDPNFFILFLRGEAEGNQTQILCSAIVNSAASQQAVSFRSFASLALFGIYCIPECFSLGPNNLANKLNQALEDEKRGYQEIAEHLEVDMSQCFVLEFLTTKLGNLGKGYGATVLKALNSKADMSKKHVILQSSSRRNVSFYLRHGYESLREEGEHITLMFRRFVSAPSKEEDMLRESP